MGFFLTLVYIAMALLSPKDLFPALAEYRVELVVVLAALLFSLPSARERRFFQIPQVYLLAGLFAAIFMSVTVASYWVVGGLMAVLKFLPAGIVFYLVLLNCQNLKRMQMLVSLLCVIAAYYVVQGSRAYLAADVTSPLLEVIHLSDGTYAFRMMGLGFLHDPNELAQFLVALLPLLWIRWRKNRHLQNIFFVLLPTILFVWGMYLTHSRGGIVALVVIVMLYLKDKVNVGSAAVGGALALALLLTLNFSGGRDVSVQAGSDRLTYWGDGLQMFKQSPLFGVGFLSFAASDFGHTAHNSFVVCLAELGLVGYAFWVALLAFTIAGLNSLIREFKKRQNENEEMRENDQGMQEDDDLDRWARAMRVSLGGFLAASFFLSRVYALPLYLILGLAAVLLYVKSGDEEPVAQPLWKMIGYSAAMGFSAITLVYAILRCRSLLT